MAAKADRCRTHSLLHHWWSANCYSHWECMDFDADCSELMDHCGADGLVCQSVNPGCSLILFDNFYSFLEIRL